MDTKSKRNPIRAARLRRGLTQSELGRLIGVRKSAVSKWELGQRLPRPAQAVELSRVLKLRLDALYNQQAA